MTFAVVAGYIELATRIAVGGAFVLAMLVAATHWAVRRGTLTPFGAWPRAIRSGSDRVLKPLERRLVKSGANPQDAPFWLLGLIVVAGLALIALVRWVLGFIGSIIFATSSDASILLPMLVNYGFGLLMAAILVRVVASWFGISRYTRGMRIIYGLTDWLLEPLQRALPTIGPFDISPIVAYLLLSFTRRLVMGAFF